MDRDINGVRADAAFLSQLGSGERFFAAREKTLQFFKPVKTVRLDVFQAQDVQRMLQKLEYPASLEKNLWSRGIRRLDDIPRLGILTFQRNRRASATTSLGQNFISLV